MSDNGVYTEQEATEQVPERRYVIWTSEEIDLLATTIAEQRLKNLQPSLHSLTESAIDHKLPEDRRKRMNGWRSQQRLYQAIRSKVDEMIRPVQAVLSVSLPEPTVEEPAVKEEIPPPPQPSLDEVLSSCPTDKLLAELLKRLTAPLSAIASIDAKLGSLEATVSRLTTKTVGSVQVSGEVATKVVYVPRVAIVGLLPGQQQEVGKALGTKMDLRFIDTNRNNKALPQCDYIVLMVKFINHSWDKAAMDTLPTQKVFRHNGGISELINLLHSLT